MSRDELIEGAGQGRHLERSAQAGGGGQIVERIARLQLIEEPQPLLRERSDRFFLGRAWHQRR
jgi:hypothetical protein